MTSEQEDSHAIWQGPDVTGWDQPPDPTTGPTPANQDLLTPPVEDDADEWEDAQNSRLEKVRQVARQFSPVLVPLPFAILIFLFTLPVALRGQSNLPLIPMGVLLIALAIMQGTLLYYAGSNDALWILYIICGYSLFLVIGTFAIFGFLASLILLIVLLFIGGFLARRAIHPLTEGHADVVLSFGRYSRTLFPGLNFMMPWEKVAARISTQEATWTCPEQKVNISRDQDVKVIATISYQLMPEDAHIAALNVKNWEDSLHQYFIGTLKSVFNELSPADFVTWSQGTQARTSIDVSTLDRAATRWDRINNSVANRVQDHVAGWGVQINSVHIQDITLIPHLAPAGNSYPGVTARPVDAGVTRGAVPMAAAPLQAQVIPNPVEKQTLPPQPQPQPAPVAEAPRVIDVDTLKDWYEAVRLGHVKDPKTIREIATRFEALANDPSINFDAVRAAQNLSQRARIYEEKEKERASIAPDVVTHSDRAERRAPNEDLQGWG